MLTVLDEQEQSRSLLDVGTLPFTEFSSFYAVNITCSIMLACSANDTALLLCLAPEIERYG